MEVAADPERPFVALNVTLNVPVSFAVGVHANVPEVLPDPAAKDALLPAGSPDRSAAKAAIASPSGSDAATVTDSGLPVVPFTLGGAVTTGGWSALSTIDVGAGAIRALL